MSDEETGALFCALPVTEARVRVIAGAVVLDVPGHEVALAFTPETARGVADSLVRLANQARPTALRLDASCGRCGAKAGERGTLYCPGCHRILSRVLAVRARGAR